jgi:putative flippase GtrA
MQTRLQQSKGNPLERNANLRTGVRFAAIGIIATLIYCGVSLLLSSRLVGLPIGWSSLAGFIVSLIVSYIGHVNFTFQVDNRLHGRFGPRFLIVAVGLAIACSLLAQLIVGKLGVAEVYVAAFIAVLYPCASFLLHSAWSFSAPAS